MSFSIGGLASGLDTNTIIQQLMQLERQPLNRLERTKSVISSEQNIFRTLNTKLKTLDNLAFDLLQSATFQPVKGTSSNEDVARITTTDSASQGTYELNITQLAKAHVVKANSFNSTDDATALVGQTFKLHHADLASPITIEAKATANNTYEEILEDIKNQVNAAKSGVTASVIETSAGVKQLVFTSTKTGSDNRMMFGTAANGTKTMLEDNGLLLASLGISDADADKEIDAANVAQAHQNAIFTLNGISITRSTNTVTDAIAGSTLNLLAVGTSMLTIDQNTEKVVAKFEEFVNAYNDAITTIRDNIKKDGKLQGDATLRSLEAQLYQFVTAFVGSAPAGYQSLEEIGISIDKGITVGQDMTGKMTLDKEKLAQKLNENVDGVMALFQNTEGIAKVLDTNLDTWTGTVNGIITNRVTGFDQEIKFINDRIDLMNQRLQIREDALRKRFVAMEVAMANAQSQQAWLSGQLAQLGSVSYGNS